MSWSGYRNSKLGDSLAEALDACITEGKLEPDQANVIMSQFDKSTAKYVQKSTLPPPTHTPPSLSSSLSFSLRRESNRKVSREVTK